MFTNESLIHLFTADESLNYIYMINQLKIFCIVDYLAYKLFHTVFYIQGD